MPEPSENWLTVGGWVGGFLAAVVTGFVAFYSRARSQVRFEAERSPEVAAAAVGAAFVDRSAAQAIVAMAETVNERIAPDIKSLLTLSQEKAEQDHDDRLAQRILERIGKDKPGG